AATNRAVGRQRELVGSTVEVRSRAIVCVQGGYDHAKALRGLDRAGEGEREAEWVHNEVAAGGGQTGAVVHLEGVGADRVQDQVVVGDDAGGIVPGWWGGGKWLLGAGGDGGGGGGGSVGRRLGIRPFRRHRDGGGAP